MGFDWSQFYRQQSGRGVRSVFARAREAWSGEPGHAIDLGCGDGVETRHLVEDGWTVLAVDSDPGVEHRVRSGLADDAQARLEVWSTSFETLDALPSADIVDAGFALPFCDADRFPFLWASIGDALRPGGLFAGELFGPHDDWFGRPRMNFHDRAGVVGLLAGMEVLHLVEDDRRGMSFEGPKRWHVFHIVARA